MQVNNELMTAAYAGQRAVKSTARGGKSEKSEALDTLKPGAPYKTEISDEAKAHGEAIKGLSAEQVDELRNGIAKSHSLMIKTLTESNAKLQAWLDEGVGFLDFGGIKIEAWNFALPPVGTTPEEAAEAIAPGGDYSVEKVADRIFGLAEAIAGGDPARLEEMRAAVEKGFELAGVAFKEAYEQDDMPQITKDTHAEIMRRFDELFAKLTGQTNEE